jgi:hypothetical protein
MTIVSAAALLKNPMILLAIVSTGLMFGIPYMVDSSKFFSNPFSYACISDINIGSPTQWTPKPVPSSKKLKRRARYLKQEQAAATRSKTLTWLRGWLGRRRRRLVRLPVVVRMCLLRGEEGDWGSALKNLCL